MRRRLAACAMGLVAAALYGGAESTPTAPPAATTPAASGSNSSPAAARALFDKAVEALGGKANIAKVRDVRTHGQVTAKAPSGEMNMSIETTMVFPDRLAQQVDGPFGRFLMIATPSSAYVLTDDGARDLPNPIRDELLRQIQRTAYFLTQKADDPKLTLGLAGEEKVGEVTTRLLDVAYGEVAVRWFVDPATGRLLRSAHDSTSPTGKRVHVTSTFSDFKTVDGFTLPYHIEVSTEGDPDQTVALEEVKINPGVDPKLFQKPLAAKPTPATKPTPAKK
jgi:hypothetical protein